MRCGRQNFSQLSWLRRGEIASKTPISARPVHELTFLRRPAVGFGASAAHQHRPLTGAQAVGLEEGLDALLVVDDCERARPVRTPQAAIETPGIEDARERVPDIREGIGFSR